jgi:hypothetical protein
VRDVTKSLEKTRNEVPVSGKRDTAKDLCEERQRHQRVGTRDILPVPIVYRRYKEKRRDGSLGYFSSLSRTIRRIFGRGLQLGDKLN